MHICWHASADASNHRTLLSTAVTYAWVDKVVNLLPPGSCRWRMRISSSHWRLWWRGLMRRWRPLLWASPSTWLQPSGGCRCAGTLTLLLPVKLATIIINTETLRSKTSLADCLLPVKPALSLQIPKVAKGFQWPTAISHSHQWCHHDC